MDGNRSNATNESSANAVAAAMSLQLFRHPPHLLCTYIIAYGVVFVVGLVGNSFVLLTLVKNRSMRSITNYFITNLAVADLLVIIFCLPATLMNNILNEWLLGNFLCKLSVWINGTTVCASVYTLVAVTGDRYFAICRPMNYNILEKRKVFYIILPIWVLSCVLFIPWLLYFKEAKFPVDDFTTARVCVPHFPSRNSEKLFFVIVNLLIAFFIPLTAITACYVYIYVTVRKLRPMAVDKQAKTREHRTKTKVTQMMITVVIGFAMSWFPLYLLFLYFYLYEPQMENSLGQVLYLVLRPLFQWLSLSNSCINPIFYAHFSQKFRRMFRLLLTHPCNCYSTKSDYGELEAAPTGQVAGIGHYHCTATGQPKPRVKNAFV